MAPDVRLKPLLVGVSSSGGANVAGLGRWGRIAHPRSPLGRSVPDREPGAASRRYHSPRSGPARSAYVRANAKEMSMAWETPTVSEIEVGMEVTAYVSSEGDDDDRID
jgi:coenzyme PQQ precursor peptide PqqA